MPSLDDCSHLFATELLDLWPLAAVLARETSGRMMGGTALAIHLQHRASEDIDIMTLKSFSGSAMARRMGKYLHEAYPDRHRYTAEVLNMEQGGYFAMIGGVKVDVFQAKPTEDVVSSQMKWLNEPIVVNGVPVGSVPDILATKLDVIMYRPKLRDYIDLAAIDRMSGYSLEDGIEFYKRKFGYDEHPSSAVIRRIVRLLSDPGSLHADSRFEDYREDVLAYLKNRAGQVLDYLAATSDMRTVPSGTHSLGLPRPGPTPVNQCGTWMPRARAYCRLPKGHRRHHRS